MDTESDTNVDRISGVSSPWTDKIPVIFLLFNEAKILEELLEDNPNRTATISGDFSPLLFLLYLKIACLI